MPPHLLPSAQPDGTDARPDLAVIIVSYNVRSFLEQTLRTVVDASEGLRVELIVVDNASTDESAEMMRERFPEARLIANAENMGFARASNQGFAHAHGRYVLFLNPDVVIHRDTLRTMVGFMDDRPEVGAAGCKLLLPDGQMELACRRSFPTPGVAFYKIVGLANLFPHNRRFGAYNLTHLDPNQEHEVDALSGSFMMVRHDTLEQVGSWDERYFMYGEDLDLCYRIKRAGWKVWYVPATEVVHFHGESARQTSRIHDRITFYKAMYIFVREHLGSHVLFPVWLLTTGIVLRGLVSVVAKGIERLLLPFLDLVLVLVGLSLGIVVRFGGLVALPPYRTLTSYLIIYGVSGLIWIAALTFVGAYRRRRYSIGSALVGVLLGFVAVTSLTFFYNQYAFSRLVALYSWLFNSALVGGARALMLTLSRTRVGAGIGRPRAVVLGTGPEAQTFVEASQQAAPGYRDIVGFVSQSSDERGETILGLGVLGSVEELGEIIQDYRVEEVIIATSQVTYSRILPFWSSVVGRSVTFKLLPSSFGGSFDVNSRGDDALLLIDLDVPRRGRLQRLLGLG